MDQKKQGKIIGNDQGMVLAVAMMLIATLMILGTTAVLTSTTDMKISSNYKASNQTLYIAEAGAEAARETLRQAVAGGSTLSALLAAARGADGSLTDSRNFSNFYANGAFVSDDTPFVPTANLGSGTYRVYLTNDPAEGVTNATDANNTVTLTSFGFGTQGSMAVVQITVGKAFPTDAPGAIVMPGPDATFDPGNGNSWTIEGDTKPAVAVNDPDSLDHITHNGEVEKRSTAITGGGLATPSIQNTVLGSPWDSVSALQDLRDQLSAVADFHSTADAGFTMGTVAAPKIVFIDGDLNDPPDGAGIVVVTGKLTLRGNYNYTGLILVLGSGEIERSGGGNGTIRGSIIMATFTGSPAIFGTSNYHTSGGGNSQIIYDASALSNSVAAMPFAKKSWKQSGLD